MPASAGGSRRSETDAAGFTASPQFAQALQQIVVDLVELHLQGKQAHWNLVGHNFRDLHLQLDQIVDDARESADTIAERMRALATVPDGRSDTVAATTTLPAFPAGEVNVSTVVDLITTRLRTTVDTLRTRHDQIDNEDPSTADLLHAIIDALEKHAWMVSAENRSA
ncbi:DNA starvation/stationary phase protection protein [Streptomyces antimycoticus]|uniref:DNA starvation/stationary phase protection protein n=1 Tax=Streptomyces antimycoticus TaxID=68175 RepID=A0A4D4KG97_9ACTN|nr:DNA starvation/stationary phase protection protein [Streptomyces antimycoticus]GDY44913.1 DNA starvation/stationary phase protection protein [Streptomyces antimycoticus]